jgi:hypothetical protein
MPSIDFFDCQHPECKAWKQILIYLVIFAPKRFELGVRVATEQDY